MKTNLYNKLLPIYFKFRPTNFWLALWSAPVRYRGSKNLKARFDTYWQALRITIRKGQCHERIIQVLKKGII